MGPSQGDKIWAFDKGRRTIHLQTFSSLLFSLSLSLCFSLCFSELPSLCFSFSLSLCFFSEWSLCSLEHRSHTCQRSSARGQMWFRWTGTRDDLGKISNRQTHKHKPYQQTTALLGKKRPRMPKSWDSTGILQPASILNTQKENANGSITAQITKALQMSFIKADFIPLYSCNICLLI